MTELERALREAGRGVEYPPTPAIADALPRLARPTATATAARRRWRLRITVAVTAVLAAAAAFLASSPGARSALRDLFRIGGVTVQRVEELPPPGAPPDYLPGRPVSLEAARAAVEFELAVPRGAAPERVLLDDTVAGGAVSMRWCCHPEVVLTQLAGTASVQWIQKLVAQPAVVERVTVHGRPGYWIAGPHVVSFIDRDGTFHQTARRRAGNVLVWLDHGVTLRLEGRLTRDRALAIARSVA